MKTEILWGVALCALSVALFVVAYFKYPRNVQRWCDADKDLETYAWQKAFLKYSIWKFAASCSLWVLCLYISWDNLALAIASSILLIIVSTILLNMILRKKFPETR